MSDLPPLLDVLFGKTPEWMGAARCRGVDPDRFFPEQGGSTSEAKEVCKGCAVREACLEYALANGEKWGVWGGLSERERRRIRRRRPLPARRCQWSSCQESFLPKNGSQLYCRAEHAEAAKSARKVQRAVRAG